MDTCIWKWERTFAVLLTRQRLHRLPPRKILSQFEDTLVSAQPPIYANFAHDAPCVDNLLEDGG